SRAIDTVPSMEFSRATKPKSTLPSVTADSTCTNDGRGLSCALASWGSLRRASSVKVPGGPRKPMVACGETAPVMGGQDRAVMDESALRNILEQFAAGAIDADEVVRRLRRLPFTELGYALVDHHRALRQGLPEAVYGPGKSVAQCVGIIG